MKVKIMLLIDLLRLFTKQDSAQCDQLQASRKENCIACFAFFLPHHFISNCYLFVNHHYLTLYFLITNQQCNYFRVRNRRPLLQPFFFETVHHDIFIGIPSLSIF